MAKLKSVNCRQTELAEQKGLSVEYNKYEEDHLPPDDRPVGVSQEPVLFELFDHMLQLRLHGRTSADENFRLGLYVIFFRSRDEREKVEHSFQHHNENLYQSTLD